MTDQLFILAFLIVGIIGLFVARVEPRILFWDRIVYIASALSFLFAIAIVLRLI